jgi:hypothetical protein
LASPNNIVSAAIPSGAAGAASPSFVPPIRLVHPQFATGTALAVREEASLLLGWRALGEPSFGLGRSYHGAVEEAADLVVAKALRPRHEEEEEFVAVASSPPASSPFTHIPRPTRGVATATGVDLTVPAVSPLATRSRVASVAAVGSRRASGELFALELGNDPSCGAAVGRPQSIAAADGRDSGIVAEAAAALLRQASAARAAGRQPLSAADACFASLSSHAQHRSIVSAATEVSLQRSHQLTGDGGGVLCSPYPDDAAEGNALASAQAAAGRVWWQADVSLRRRRFELVTEERQRRAAAAVKALGPARGRQAAVTGPGRVSPTPTAPAPPRISTPAGRMSPPAPGFPQLPVGNPRSDADASWDGESVPSSEAEDDPGGWRHPDGDAQQANDDTDGDSDPNREGSDDGGDDAEGDSSSMYPRIPLRRADDRDSVASRRGRQRRGSEGVNPFLMGAVEHQHHQQQSSMRRHLDEASEMVVLLPRPLRRNGLAMRVRRVRSAGQLRRGDRMSAPRSASRPDEQAGQQRARGKKHGRAWDVDSRDSSSASDRLGGRSDSSEADRVDAMLVSSVASSGGGGSMVPMPWLGVAEDGYDDPVARLDATWFFDGGSDDEDDNGGDVTRPCRSARQPVLSSNHKSLDAALAATRAKDRGDRARRRAWLRNTAVADSMRHEPPAGRPEHGRRYLSLAPKTAKKQSAPSVAAPTAVPHRRVPRKVTFAKGRALVEVFEFEATGSLKEPTYVVGRVAAVLAPFVPPEYWTEPHAALPGRNLLVAPATVRLVLGAQQRQRVAVLRPERRDSGASIDTKRTPCLPVMERCLDEERNELLESLPLPARVVAMAYRCARSLVLRLRATHGAVVGGHLMALRRALGPPPTRPDLVVTRDAVAELLLKLQQRRATASGSSTTLDAKTERAPVCGPAAVTQAQRTAWLTARRTALRRRRLEDSGADAECSADAFMPEAFPADEDGDWGGGGDAAVLGLAELGVASSGAVVRGATAKSKPSVVAAAALETGDGAALLALCT